MAKFKRERRILDLLNRGVSVAEIAAREGVREKSMRALVREILARRMPEPPAEFVALQVSRLNEALLVAYGAMSGANLGAVDRVVKIVRELDRYHGFFAAERRSLPDAPRLKAPAQETLALAALATDRLKMAPQQPEMIDRAGKRMAPKPSNWRAGGGGIGVSPCRPSSDPLALAALVDRSPVNSQAARSLSCPRTRASRISGWRRSWW